MTPDRLPEVIVNADLARLADPPPPSAPRWLETMSNENVSTTGDRAAASTTGDRAAASTTGDWAAASTTGNWAAASTTGNWAAASTTGYGAAAVTLGVDGWAKAGPGGTIALAYDDGTRRRILVAYPGETEGIEPGVWHHVVNGEIAADPDMLVPQDGRGYCLRHENGRYVAGCRDFSADEAIAHWSNPAHEVPRSAALLLAAVREHVARTGGAA